MTKEEAATVVSTVKELWPGSWDITDTTFRVWWRVLGDVSYQAAVEALLLMAATRTFYPRPGPVDVWQEVHRVDTPDEEEAWQTARGYLSRSFPDLGVYPPGGDDASLPARAYRLAGGYSVVNDARYGRRAFQKAWQQVVDGVNESQARELPAQITRRKEIGS